MRIPRLLFCASLLFIVSACSTAPAPTAAPPATLAPTADAPATETAVAARIFATLTASAPKPTLPPTLTPPPPPTAIPTNPPPTAVPTEQPSNTPAPPPTAASLSPSITPRPVIPTQAAPAGPTLTPTLAPLTVSREALRGKILFKSTRGGGSYPNKYNFVVMDPDGANAQVVDKAAALALYQQLKPLEGYSPDRTMVVVGEVTCGNKGHCDLYVGEPSVVVNRSQGIWTGGPDYARAYDPAWSPNGDMIVFLWNVENDRTKNIFKGQPFQKQPNFTRLTDFGGGRDSKDPTFSPDGSQVAFATQDGPRWQIWVLDAQAPDYRTSNPHNLSNSEYDDWDPIWIK